MWIIILETAAITVLVLVAAITLRECMARRYSHVVPVHQKEQRTTVAVSVLHDVQEAVPMEVGKEPDSGDGSLP